MSREIRFRAWHKENRYMFEVHEYMPPQAPAFVGSVANSVLTQFPLTAVEIMQATGLKDKNGVDLFEGDIINHQRYGNNHEVYWNGEAGGFFLRPGCWPLTRLCEKNIEKLGTIYEHPELMKSGEKHGA